MIKIEKINSKSDKQPHYFGSKCDEYLILEVTNCTNETVDIITIRFSVKRKANPVFNESKSDKLKLQIQPNSIRNIVFSKDYIKEKFDDFDFIVKLVDSYCNVFEIDIENQNLKH